jgi:hypothetical protein
LSDLEQEFEEELPADAVVIRGGQMKAESLKDAAEAYWAKFEGKRGYALTVWCWPGHTAEEIAQAVGSHRLPHREMRKSTVERLRELGYPLEPSFGEHHYSLRLPDPPTPQDWVNLDLAFDPPQPNPVGLR